MTPEKWVNPYVFHAYRSGNVTSPNNAAAKVQLNAELYDDNDNFDSSTNYRYTAPVTGLYHFDCQVALGASTIALSARVFVNGSIVKEFSRTVGVSNNAYSSGSFDYKLTAGDYVELYVFTSANTGQVIGQAEYTFMSGHLVKVI